MKRIVLLLIFVLIVCVGCQKKQKLTGKITFPDGKPLSIGVVYFVTDSYMGRGRINADGTYDVGASEEIVMDSPMKSLIQSKYTSLDTSPLKFTIPGEKEFNFTVEAPWNQYCFRWRIARQSYRGRKGER